MSFAHPPLSEHDRAVFAAGMSRPSLKLVVSVIGERGTQAVAGCEEEQIRVSNHFTSWKPSGRDFVKVQDRAAEVLPGSFTTVAQYEGTVVMQQQREETR